MKKLFTIVCIFLFMGISYSQITTLWERSVSNSNLPIWFSSNNERGFAYGNVGGNDRLYIVSRSTTYGNNIYIYNAVTGDSVGKLVTTGISGGLFIINDVEVSSTE